MNENLKSGNFMDLTRPIETGKPKGYDPRLTPPKFTEAFGDDAWEALDEMHADLMADQHHGVASRGSREAS